MVSVLVCSLFMKRPIYRNVINTSETCAKQSASITQHRSITYSTLSMQALAILCNMYHAALAGIFNFGWFAALFLSIWKIETNCVEL